MLDIRSACRIIEVSPRKGTKMDKYTIRRFVVALLFTPALVGAYWLLLFVFATLGFPSNYDEFPRTAGALAVTAVLVFTFYPQIRRFVNRLTEPKDD